jgi:hypothetical protein
VMHNVAARLGIVVDAPVKTVSALVAHIVTERAGEDDAAVNALHAYHAEVREYLICLQRGKDDDAAVKLGELEGGLDGLRAALISKGGSGNGGQGRLAEEGAGGVAGEGEGGGPEEAAAGGAEEQEGGEELVARSKPARKGKKGKKRAD